MFGIDFSEILLIFGIALVVLGPEKLPKLANTIGRWIGRARGMARQFRDQLEQETHTLHQGMDLGPDFSSRPGAHPGTGGSVPRPTADSSTSAAVPPQPEPRIHPRPVGPPSPLDANAAAGTEPAAAEAPMAGPPLPEMGLADTYPAAFHPYQPPPITEPPSLTPAGQASANPAPATSPGPAASAATAAGPAPAAGPASPAASASPASGPVSASGQAFPAPHETAHWPPDGVL